MTHGAPRAPCGGFPNRQAGAPAGRYLVGGLWAGPDAAATTTVATAAELLAAGWADGYDPDQSAAAGVASAAAAAAAAAEANGPGGGGGG